MGAERRDAISGRPGKGVGDGRPGAALILLSAACFGSLGVLGRWADQAGLGLFTFLGLRFALGGLILAGLCRLRGVGLWPGGRAARGLALLGVLYVGQSLCFFASLQRVPVAVTAILLYTYPVVVTLAAWPLHGDRPDRERIAVLVLCTTGVVLVVNPFGVGTLDAVGVLLGLGAAAVYSTYILAGTTRLEGVPPLTAGAGVALTAGTTLLLAGVLTGHVATPSLRALPVIALAAVIPTVVAATAFLAGLTRVGPTRTSILSTVEPVATALLAAVILGERLAPVQVGGGAMVVLGAALLARPRRTPILPA